MYHNKSGVSRLLVIVALALGLASVGPGASSVTAGGGDGEDVPRVITVNAPVQRVYCSMGCCCGSVSVRYHGHWYDTGPRGFCRWFRPLRDGQIVRARVWLVR